MSISPVALRPDIPEQRGAPGQQGALDARIQRVWTDKARLIAGWTSLLAGGLFLVTGSTALGITAGAAALVWVGLFLARHGLSNASWAEEPSFAPFSSLLRSSPAHQGVNLPQIHRFPQHHRASAPAHLYPSGQRAEIGGPPPAVMPAAPLLVARAGMPVPPLDLSRIPPVPSYRSPPRQDRTARAAIGAAPPAPPSHAPVGLPNVVSARIDSLGSAARAPIGSGAPPPPGGPSSSERRLLDSFARPQHEQTPLSRLQMRSELPPGLRSSGVPSVVTSSRHHVERTPPSAPSQPASRPPPLPPPGGNDAPSARAGIGRRPR